MRDSDITQNPSNCKASPSPSEFSPSPAQQAVLDGILVALARPGKKFVHLDGFAGTGKSSLAGYIGRLIPDVVYAAYTGKAAQVLREKGCEDASTLHRLIYGYPIVETDKQGNKRLAWVRRDEAINAKLIIADECSMISRELALDLLKLGPPVVVTGDKAQLPPIGGPAFFNAPDFTLSEIHRQAAGSQPLQLATAIREGERIRPVPFDPALLMQADIVITAFEATRQRVNKLIRRRLGRVGYDPVAGDRLLCFRNDYSTGCFNGTLWSITTVGDYYDTEEGHVIDLDLVDDIGNEAEVTVAKRLFYGADPRKIEYDPDSDLTVFSYGYCITCHKSQGSEWPSVVVIDESRSPGFPYIAGDLPLPEFRRRWLYTAVTRAKQHVVVMEPRR